MIKPIILSGGGGTRLWPLSRTHFPKQYWALVSEKTLLQETLLRVNNKEIFQDPLIICNEEHRFLVAEQCRQAEIKPSHIVLESESRNTAYAIAIACLLQEDLDSLLLVLPADHVIQNVDAFLAAIESSRHFAAEGKIMTFGIKPNCPHTQYGYIQKGKLLFDKKHKDRQNNAQDIFEVKRFTEKPNLETAKTFLTSEDYFWNSGIYLFKARVLLSELEKYHSDLVAGCRKAVSKAKPDLDFLRLDASYPIQKKDCLSIDYAVMERTSHAAIIPVDMGWSDVGTWDVLWSISPKDKQGNVLLGDVITHNVSNSYIRTDKQFVSILGLDNVVVVSTLDALLVSNKDCVPQVKEIVHELKENKRQEMESHARVYRPWGYYQCVDKGEGFQVKRLMVKAGGKTSTQIHHHRSEHWIVVEGTAKVTRGDETFFVHENESVYLPKGIKHRVENPGKIPLHVVEVQSGSYLGEDDIVRLEDEYGRASSSVKNPVDLLPI